jgi:hypothetical protein
MKEPLCSADQVYIVYGKVLWGPPRFLGYFRKVRDGAQMNKLKDREEMDRRGGKTRGWIGRGLKI